MTLDELAAFPELQGDTFPFRGYRDFRKMDNITYAAFSAGVFAHVAFHDRCKWFGEETASGLPWCDS